MKISKTPDNCPALSRKICNSYQKKSDLWEKKNQDLHESWAAESGIYNISYINKIHLEHIP